ncbi:hypothetical protein PAXRUDRAFT_830211 [Paxillus rubicundulus Ve08.2h10]|uniref:Uncharacterized protein n=1 Tax=Paxillus rubicundulus Ve08.2h10 TaxID=930991 RepID=A0A0D0DTU7_9AGAM|nr:hypothetical protein PAXRUDRAFT_830211 [Paxillus rubicundulus Ve08.2h10]
MESWVDQDTRPRRFFDYVTTTKYRLLSRDIERGMGFACPRRANRRQLRTTDKRGRYSDRAE